jgi:transcriptional regulator with XRE-family HTH domain
MGKYIKEREPLPPDLHQTKVHLVFGFELLMKARPHQTSVTQSDLSRFSKVGAYQISNMLNVRHPYTPTLKTLTKLLKYFDMTPTDFYVMVAENITIQR